MHQTFNSIKELLAHFSIKGKTFDISQIDELKDVSRELKLELILNEPAEDDNHYELQTPPQILKVTNSVGTIIWTGNISKYIH